MDFIEDFPTTENIQEREYALIELPVYKPYRIQQIDGQDFIIGCQENLPTYYNPLSKSKLLLNAIGKFELSVNKPNNISEQDRDKIIGFCNEYGLPGSIQGRDIPSYTVFEFADILETEERSNLLSKIATPYLDGAKSLKNDMHEYSKTSGRRYSNGVFAQHIRGFMIEINHIRSLIEDIYLYADMQNNLDKRVLMHRIAGGISVLLSGVNLQVAIKFINKSYGVKFVNEYDFSKLAQVVGFILYEIVFKGRLAICSRQNCGNYFVPKRRNNIYCSDECKNAQNQQVHRNSIKNSFKTL
jgi:hypothetical protein